MRRREVELDGVYTWDKAGFGDGTFQVSVVAGVSETGDFLCKGHAAMGSRVADHGFSFCKV